MNLEPLTTDNEDSTNPSNSDDEWVSADNLDSYFEQMKKNVELVAAEEPSLFPVGEKSIEDVVA